jgi:hypothetical protein
MMMMKFVREPRRPLDSPSGSSYYIHKKHTRTPIGEKIQRKNFTVEFIGGEKEIGLFNVLFISFMTFHLFADILTPFQRDYFFLT